MTDEQILQARRQAGRYGLFAALLFTERRPALLHFLFLLPEELPAPIRGLLEQQAEVVRDLLQEDFDRIVTKLALIATHDISAWLKQMQLIVGGYLEAQAIVAKGRPLFPSEFVAVQDIIDDQLNFLDVFLFDLLKRRITPEYVANRAKLYGGAGRGLWYRIWEDREEVGTVVDFLSIDDRVTCRPCLKAGESGPYLLGQGPFPGEVCLGRGRCRCLRRARHDVEAYGQLLLEGVA